MKITNKKRFITSISILTMLVVSIFNLCFAKSEIVTEDYVVTAGDTLWSIASEHTTGDIRDYIYEWRQLNNLNDCTIYPNQTIKIIK